MSVMTRRLFAHLKQHQHRAGLRQGLDGIQVLYDLARTALGDVERPAFAGGRPVRLVPLPPPKPFSRHERRELLRVLAAQNTSFYDGGAVQRFEQLCARELGAKHAIAVSSGTAALHVALVAAGIGSGDEVIVPALTYVSTAFAPLYQGARPVFVDVDPVTFQLDVTLIEAALTPRTRAILPVHLCGVPCDMAPLLELARRHSLTVVEDAAQALGALHDGRHVGTLGDLGCFSFGSTKSVVTGEGGLVLTDDAELARRARLAMSLSERVADGSPTHEEGGWSPGAELAYERLGWNYRLGALQAAVGIAQLERLDEIHATRARNAARLHERLGDFEGLAIQRAPSGTEPCLSTFLVTVERDRDGLDRDGLAAGLAHERIDHRIPPAPLPTHKLFASTGSFPVADRVHRRGLGLRVDPALGRREMDACAEAVRRVLAWREPRHGATAAAMRGSRRTARS